MLQCSLCCLLWFLLFLVPAAHCFSNFPFGLICPSLKVLLLGVLWQCLVMTQVSVSLWIKNNLFGWDVVRTRSTLCTQIPAVASWLQRQRGVYFRFRQAAYVVGAQVSVGLSIHHMGSLIHGWFEVQISAIVTVCWWVDWDQKRLPWQPVMTGANLKIYFEPVLSGRDLANSPCGQKQQLENKTCLFRLLYNAAQSLAHTEITPHKVSTHLLWALSSFLPRKIHRNTRIIDLKLLTFLLLWKS